jgi:hypothetical protein
MSVYFNQTNLTPGTSQFITRAEVIAGFSTLVNDLSGGQFNISSIFNNPNPVVSSITVNPSGTISNPAAVQATRHIVSTVGALAPTAPLSLSNVLRAPGITDTTGNLFADVYAKNFNAQNTNTNQNGLTLSYGWTGIQGKPVTGPVQNLVSWIPAIGAGTSGFILQNVSTINGVPVLSSLTSYTTLNGTNINNTGVINTPSVVGVSSLNGVSYPPAAVQATSVTATQTVNTSSLTATGTATIANLAATLGSFGGRTPLVNAVVGGGPTYVAFGYEPWTQGKYYSTIQGSMVFATVQPAGANLNPITCQVNNATSIQTFGNATYNGQPAWWMTIGR